VSNDRQAPKTDWRDTPYWYLGFGVFWVFWFSDPVVKVFTGSISLETILGSICCALAVVMAMKGLIQLLRARR
jgi:hypothetical protein